jgi:hypothetical protein
VLDSATRDIVEYVNIRIRLAEQVVSPIRTDEAGSSEDQSRAKLH